MLQGIDTDKSNQIRIRSMLEIVQEVVTCKQVFIWIKFNTSHTNSLNSLAGITAWKNISQKSVNETTGIYFDLTENSWFVIKLLHVYVRITKVHVVEITLSSYFAPKRIGKMFDSLYILVLNPEVKCWNF